MNLPDRRTDERRPPRPAAADVESVEAIVAALYAAITFRAGEQPNYDRLRSLFAPGGRLIHVRPDGLEEMSIETFVTRFRQQYEAGALKEFAEREVASTTERFGHVAHVFSTYEARFVADDPRPAARGVNSIQLRKDDSRWWVVTVLWFDESAAHPIPAEYLSEK